MSTEITSLSLHDVAAALAKRQLSAVEVTDACLSRMQTLNPVLDCAAEIMAVQARKDARAADALRDTTDNPPPLLGVPLAHKDMYYRAGRISGCGSKIRASFVPDHTSTALSRLDAAGALDIARLNMVEFALGVTGHNDVMPTPKNPWNRDHMTGGSSSGSGVSVAARIVYGALGSDTGGSIRLPAAACGLVGMKPTYGRVSRYGAMPLSHSLDTVGPLTRTIKDNALMMRAISGRDEKDPTSSPLPVPDYLDGIDTGIRGLRIGIPETYFYDDMDPAIEAIVRASLDVLESLGGILVPVKLPSSIAVTNALCGLMTTTEGVALHKDWLKNRWDDYGKQTRNRFSAGLLMPASGYLEALNGRARILADFAAAVFETADVLHTPVIPIPIPTTAQSSDASSANFFALTNLIGRCTRPVNYLGLPGLNVPCGFTGPNLPVSFQLVGRPFDEKTLYRVGQAYETATDWHAQSPNI
ncbi:MAG: amidase [Rhodospirillales bacterium]|nr:amidase [Rhodospirillales bacterium]